MKKFVVLSLVGLFLAFGATVYGQEKAPVLEFKASGFIDAKYFVYRNITPGSGAIYTSWPAPFLPNEPGISVADKAAWDETASWWESRARLKFDAVMGKALSGTIFFEADSTRWGDLDGTRNVAGRWDADRPAVEVKNFYIDFGVPGIPIPVSMRVGVQPLSLRPHVLVYTDGPGVTAGIKVDPVNIGLMYFKAYEGQDVTADDINIYGLHANTKVGTLTVGGYGLNFDMKSYPIPSALPAYGTSAANRADFWWYGVYADGKFGPVNLNLDLVIDRGEVESRTPGIKDVKYRGWVAKLKVDYPWEKFNFGGSVLYASGADQKKTSATGLPGAITPWGTTASKVGSFIVTPGSAQVGGGDSLVFYGTYSNTLIGYSPSTNYNQVSRGCIGGTWFAKLSAGFKATSWYKVTLEALYIGDTTKSGNTIGNAVKADGNPRDDKTIGWELDLINEINIYKNLKWDVGLGILFAGDAMDQRITGTNTNASPKNPYILQTKLTYTF